MTPRETFLHVCTQITAQLDGFRLLQKGQVLKKDLPDRDTICEIRFQGSRNNSAHNITMLVHLTLSSRQFKQWAQSQSLPNGDVSGVFYANQLGYLTPRKDWRNWRAPACRTACATSSLTCSNTPCRCATCLPTKPPPSPTCASTAAL